MVQASLSIFLREIGCLERGMTDLSDGSGARRVLGFCFFAATSCFAAELAFSFRILKKGWYQEGSSNSMPVESGRRKHIEGPKLFFLSRKLRQSAIHQEKGPKSPLTGLYLVVSWLTFRIM